MIDVRRAKRYCKEDISKIENYDKAIADKTQTWECHHRTEIWWNCTAKDLIENECYYDRKALELIFLTSEEHKSLHNTGKTFNAETRKKISESQKGKPKSDEHRQKMSAAQKGHSVSAETRRKISEAMKKRKAQEVK